MGQRKHRNRHRDGHTQSDGIDFHLMSIEELMRMNEEAARCSRHEDQWPAGVLLAMRDEIERRKLTESSHA